MRSMILSEGCESCHEDYRIITATMYRAPDFSLMEISPSTSCWKCTWKNLPNK